MTSPAPGVARLTVLRDYHRRAAAELKALIESHERMIEALIECEDYFDNRADADCEGDPLEFVPNKEMRLLDTVRLALQGDTHDD